MLRKLVSTFVRRRKKGLWTFLLGPLTCSAVLFNPSGKRIYKKQAVILCVPAFQAGCRGFEPRLPLFSMNRLSESAWQAASQKASGERNRRRRFVCSSSGVQRTPASFCGKDLPHVLGQPAFGWWQTPASSREEAPALPGFFPAAFPLASCLCSGSSDRWSCTLMISEVCLTCCLPDCQFVSSTWKGIRKHMENIV